MLCASLGPICARRTTEKSYYLKNAYEGTQWVKAPIVPGCNSLAKRGILIGAYEGTQWVKAPIVPGCNSLAKRGIFIGVMVFPSLRGTYDPLPQPCSLSVPQPLQEAVF